MAEHLTPENERFYAVIAERRGRELTPAERNIDIAGLQGDLEDGKKLLTLAVEEAKLRAIRRWLMHDQRIELKVGTTPKMEKILADLYDAGERHGDAELARAGYKSFAARNDYKARKLYELLLMLQAKLSTLTARLQRTSTDLDLASMSRSAIARALAKVPGAKDVAGRMVSSATYRGLGAAFDRASDQVDATPDQAGGMTGGGNGWEYTAVMDGATCLDCAGRDGRTYATWVEAQGDLPGGGPNPFCYGDGRCRCRLAPRAFAPA